VPLGGARWCADHLVDLAAWAAQQCWPWLVRAADLPGASWSADASWLWLMLAVPAVVCVLAPLPVPMRLGGLVLLCSGFLQRSPTPAPGSLEVVMFDVGASRAVLLRTAGHQLLLGTGESFGTQGRRFEREVLPELQRAAGSLDLLLDRSDRDSLQALAVARAKLPLRQAISGSPKSAPELLPCADEDWQWDNVQFIRRASPDGCWQGARAGGRLLLVAPTRMPSGQIPQFGPATVQVLPRRARDAGLLTDQAAPDAVALASLSSSEWQSTGWRALRESRGASGKSLWTTANQGTVRLVLHADGRLKRTAAPAWRAGIWASTDRACPAP
jgi:hypothetical protein